MVATETQYWAKQTNRMRTEIGKNTHFREVGECILGEQFGVANV